MKVLVCGGRSFADRDRVMVARCRAAGISVVEG